MKYIYISATLSTVMTLGALVSSPRQVNEPNVPDQIGISRLYNMLGICYSGLEPSKCTVFLSASCLNTFRKYLFLVAFGFRCCCGCCFQANELLFNVLNS